ncbi:TPA: division/cell wall cluster transcriptional repressor MraZ [bacterium]|nr:division/cell wall cluster transcriptional repressor MraZ [bacterium]
MENLDQISPITSEHIVENGRIILPSRFRKRLSKWEVKSVVIARGYDGCLCLYLPDDWRAFVERMNRMPKIRSRALARKLFFGATEETLDRQGRLVIPQMLREYAKITKEVVFFILPDRAEIWDKKTWEEYDKEIEFEAIGEELETHSGSSG